MNAFVGSLRSQSGPTPPLDDEEDDDELEPLDPLLPLEPLDPLLLLEPLLPLDPPLDEDDDDEEDDDEVELAPESAGVDVDEGGGSFALLPVSAGGVAF